MAAETVHGETELQKAERELLSWLDTVGKGYAQRYGKILIDEGYDNLHELADATQEDLLELNVKKAHSRKIMAALKLRAEESVSTADLTTHTTTSTASPALKVEQEERPPPRPKRRQKPPSMSSPAIRPETPPTSDDDEPSEAPVPTRKWHLNDPPPARERPHSASFWIRAAEKSAE